MEAGGDGHPEPGRLIELRDVDKVYTSGRLEYHALRGVDLSIDTGELVAIVGPSGSGKSTALNLITGIDRATTGSVVVGGADLGEMNEEQLAMWRGTHVGIVFQFFQLLPTLTALENAMLPMDFGPRSSSQERRSRALQHLALVGMEDKADHLPAELSGGEQQRVAIARALARDPSLLVADEPTGNLDTETAHQVMGLLRNLNRNGTTVVYVTHDADLAAHARRIVAMRDGRIVDGD